MKMEIEYPTEERIQTEKDKILAALPKRRTLREKIKDIYWTPGIRVVFYQCGSAWLITGMVYLMIYVCILLSPDDERYRTFFSLVLCPSLYLVFSSVSLLSEEQASVIELKQTLRCSYTHLVSLRMFYSSIIAALLDILLLYGSQYQEWHCRPWHRLFPETYGSFEPQTYTAALLLTPRGTWAVGAAGISSMFLFSLLSLYLYHRLKRCWHNVLMLALWTALCAAVTWDGSENVCHFLFEELPLAVHLTIAACCVAGTLNYMRKETIST